MRDPWHHQSISYHAFCLHSDLSASPNHHPRNHYPHPRSRTSARTTASATRCCRRTTPRPWPAEPSPSRAAWRCRATLTRTPCTPPRSPDATGARARRGGGPAAAIRPLGRARARGGTGGGRGPRRPPSAFWARLRGRPHCGGRRRRRGPLSRPPHPASHPRVRPAGGRRRRRRRQTRGVNCSPANAAVLAAQRRGSHGRYRSRSGCTTRHRGAQ